MGIGDSLKSWAKSKATEMLSADSGKAESAAANADAAEQDVKDQAGEQLIRAAFPKVGEWQDAQEEKQRVAAATRDKEYADEIAGLPAGTLALTTTGTFAGQWSGAAQARWEEIPPVKGADPEWQSTDPYADKPTRIVEVFPASGAAIDGHGLVRWRFEIPGYAGDGTYDLVAMAKAREAANAMPEYSEWVLEFADHSDAAFYFYPEAGPSTVTVADGGTKLSIAMGMGGAMGDVNATAEVTLAG